MSGILSLIVGIIIVLITFGTWCCLVIGAKSEKTFKGCPWGTSFYFWKIKSWVSILWLIWLKDSNYFDEIN